MNTRNGQRTNFRYTYTTNGTQNNYGATPNFTYRRTNDVQPTYLYVLLLAMFVLFALSSNLFSEQPYIMEKQGEYVVQHITHLNIEYYTKSSYEQKYSNAKRYEIEDNIDRQYLMMIFENCRYDKQRNWSTKSQPASCRKYHELEDLYKKKPSLNRS